MKRNNRNARDKLVIPNSDGVIPYFVGEHCFPTESGQRKETPWGQGE
jgi:hypothetical protein